MTPFFWRQHGETFIPVHHVQFENWQTGQLSQATTQSRLARPTATKNDHSLHQRSLSDSLQIGGRSPAGVHRLVGLDAEYVVPCSRCSPHFVVLQQIRINENTKRLRKTKRGYATSGFGNPRISLQYSGTSSPTSHR